MTEIQFTFRFYISANSFIRYQQTIKNEGKTFFNLHKGNFILGFLLSLYTKRDVKDCRISVGFQFSAGSQQDLSKISAGSQKDLSRISARSLQDFIKISAGSHQDLSRISAEFQQDLSMISARSQQDLSKISARSQQDLSRISAGS